ncbi:PorT family protein [bacterium]|nr:MAG: PorT family protein [bacterium]
MLNKYLNVLCLSLLAFSPASSQVTNRITLLAGTNLAWGANDIEHYSTDSRYGYNAGFSIAKSERLGYSLGVVYSHNRAKYKMEEYSYQYHAVLRRNGIQSVSYIDFTPMITYTPERSRFTIGIGIGYSLAIGAKSDGHYLASENYGNGAFAYGEDYKIENKKSFQRADWGGIVSTGISLTKGFGLEIQYRHGLTNITKNDLSYLKTKRSSVSLFVSKTIWSKG